MKFIKNQILVSIIYELFDSLFGLQVAISNQIVSYCSTRMNYTHRFGCSSTLSDGIIKVVRSKLNMDNIFTTEIDEKIILVLPTFMFTDPSIMKLVLYCQMLSGIIVLAPSKGDIYNVHHFTEKRQCKEDHQICNRSKFDLFSNGYYYTQWGIPVVLLTSRNLEFQQNIIDCYEKYNFMNDKGSKCKIKIRNHNPHELNVEQCLYESNTLKKRFQLNNENAFCKVINGLNIYITFNKGKQKYNRKSIILICAKMDTISMFDTAAVGAEELYPRAALMIHMATIFQHSLETIFNITRIKYFTSNIYSESFEPLDLINCFVNTSCNLLKNIIGPKEQKFYEYYANPFKAQSFVDGFISTKHGRYYNRFSEFILKLLIIYLGHEKLNEHNCYDVAGLKFFSIEVFDELKCFETKIQVSRDFNPLTFLPNSVERNEEFFKTFPIWMQNGVLRRQYVQLYVSVDTEIYITSMVIGTIITALCFVSSIFLYRNINSLIPEDQDW